MLEMMPTVGVLGASILGGYACFRGILHLVPRLEGRESRGQRDEVLAEARRQRESILEVAAKQWDDKKAILDEELAGQIQERKDEVALAEQELSPREAATEAEKKRISTLFQQLKEREERLGGLKEESLEVRGRLEAVNGELAAALAQQAGVDAGDIVRRRAEDLAAGRQLESQKQAKAHQETLNSSAKKLAQRLLDRTHARYAPKFVWPKSSTTIDVATPKIGAVVARNEDLLAEMAELSGCNVQFVRHKDEQDIGFLRVAGGFGIHREAARFALSGQLASGSLARKRVIDSYQSQRRRLEGEAAQLGRKAVDILRLEGIHPEIQKLVGALNWRTSYRQNQWYHTVEVAVLAGIIASEVGVDPDEAKRVGMLHDIGKAIDYRIEGSHAVISGDYADRFGECRHICDTVMSHHSDIIIETPLAYVLRAADTLSGARPGARVNLEEGYQIRLGAIHDVVAEFPGVADVAIMNGGREVHIQVDHKRVSEKDVEEMTKGVARRIEESVAFPGQIKVLVTRLYEAVVVA